MLTAKTTGREDLLQEARLNRLRKPQGKEEDNTIWRLQYALAMGIQGVFMGHSRGIQTQERGIQEHDSHGNHEKLGVSGASEMRR